MITLLLIHGFLDDINVWDDLVSELPDDARVIRCQLPGFGTRADEPSPDLALQALAAEAGQLLDEVDSDVIVVGQSLGTQVAELVAAGHAGKVTGLVLLTPVPLGGTRLPEDALGPFRALGGDPGAQRAARSTLSPALTDAQLDRLTRTGAWARPDVVSRYVDVWNNGVADAPSTSDFTGPVLVIRGGADSFVTDQLVSTITPRFPQARERVIERGGHWVHVEFAAEVASAIVAFADEIAGRATSAGWRRAFAEQSRAGFAEAFADGVVLDATTLIEPVVGRDAVATVLGVASSIYEALEFTAETTDGSTSYVQWRATAFGGMAIRGITILDRDAEGRIVSAAIHHRPLGVVLRFSAEIRDRLAGVIPSTHFLQETR
ncbi:alpha/beta fold hydrolase [Mycolicibacterium nivoides]|uniref:alpha/beta fold hydrolase n=1 Tax=Mycolicibacterium nivoides TaxID=2487344 RepID=UPI0008BB2EAE|nr:alpha/beta hydrolase [Mycolicibacterium nivoides]SEQ61529.1 Pimeloyl-ACP methyl ester carboxylesterase [Mycobacterium sp. 88mf]SFF68904.1 Pimeloyl-ACP methyl ester carboxylesterase [Mycobacterium sp. 455mf]